MQRGAEAADRCRELPFGGFGLGGGATPRRQPQCVVHVAASVCRTPRCTTCCPGTGVSGGVDRRINGEQRVVGTTRCRAGRQDAASRQASSRLLRCAPALRVTRRNVLTHRVFMAGSELPATSRPTSSPEVNPHIFVRHLSAVSHSHQQLEGRTRPVPGGRLSPHAVSPNPPDIRGSGPLVPWYLPEGYDRAHSHLSKSGTGNDRSRRVARPHPTASYQTRPLIAIR